MTVLTRDPDNFPLRIYTPQRSIQKFYEQEITKVIDLLPESFRKEARECILLLKKQCQSDLQYEFIVAYSKCLQNPLYNGRSAADIEKNGRDFWIQNNSKDKSGGKISSYSFGPVKFSNNEGATTEISRLLHTIISAKNFKPELIHKLNKIVSESIDHKELEKSLLSFNNYISKFPAETIEILVDAISFYKGNLRDERVFNLVINDVNFKHEYFEFIKPLLSDNLGDSFAILHGVLRLKNPDIKKSIKEILRIRSSYSGDISLIRAVAGSTDLTKIHEKHLRIFESLSANPFLIQILRDEKFDLTLLPAMQIISQFENSESVFAAFKSLMANKNFSIFKSKFTSKQFLIQLSEKSKNPSDLTNFLKELRNPSF